MNQVLLGFVLSLSAFVAPVGVAGAWDGSSCGPWASSAAFPTLNPPGWYTNTYSYAWYYPWYAYYNSSQGPYANWTSGQGFATYGNLKQPVAVPVVAQVTVFLPADAKLLFSGVPATGTGAIRTFTTPPLEANQEYAYDMGIEIIKDGNTIKMSKLVMIQPGANLQVHFDLAESTVPKK
jgi:uncharacterized protein (TIGR03000 family)